MRLEIVYRNGGYYFDTTFEILKPLYNLLNKKKYRFVGCNEIPRFKNVDILSNSFFGATKNNPIIKRLLSKSKLNKIDFYNSSVDFDGNILTVQPTENFNGLLEISVQVTDGEYIDSNELTINVLPVNDFRELKEDDLESLNIG